MSKLIMMRGLPASGKTTTAKAIVANGGDFVRVNRDMLREMMHSSKWSGRNEEITYGAEMAIAHQALRHGRSVVVDDTNLNPKNEAMWRGLAIEEEATFEVQNINTDVKTCLQRDQGREKAVGGHVIVNMALQYGLYPKPDKGFVLCDLDGTLFDITHRLKYARGEEKNWDKFFDEIPGDLIRTSTVDTLLEFEEKGFEIIFVSARPERFRAATEIKILEAFNQYEISKTLIMRRDHDKRDDTEVKQQIFDNYFASHEGKIGYHIEAVIDDRPKVIRMWQANGLNVIDVGNGEEF